MKYKLLLIITYLLYAISFMLPAYTYSTLFNVSTEIWQGWKCALVTFALIFTKHSVFAGIALTLPNVFMILLAIMHKRIGLVFLILILIFNFFSCSSWWFSELAKGNISELLQGYWIWLISIITSNTIFIIRKHKIANI